MSRNYKTQLQKRHFELFADAIRSTDMPADVRDLVAKQLCGRLQTTNPQFNASRFITACGCN